MQPGKSSSVKRKRRVGTKNQKKIKKFVQIEALPSSIGDNNKKLN